MVYSEIKTKSLLGEESHRPSVNCMSVVFSQTVELLRLHQD